MTDSNSNSNTNTTSSNNNGLAISVVLNGVESLRVILENEDKNYTKRAQNK